MVGFFARMTYGDRAHRDRAILKIHSGGVCGGVQVYLNVQDRRD